MARRKPGPRPDPDGKRTQGGDRHVNPRVAFHLSAELLAALEAHIAATRPQPTTTSVIIAALEDYLQQRGFWPPTAAPSS